MKWKASFENTNQLKIPNKRIKSTPIILKPPQRQSLAPTTILKNEAKRYTFYS